MKKESTFATLLELFFTDRLMRQKGASSNTIASYRDSFRLLFKFAQKQLKKSPSDLTGGCQASCRLYLKKYFH